MQYTFVLLFILLFFGIDVSAQETIRKETVVTKRFFKVGNVSITGNKKTKNKIILRELHFYTGDTIYYADSSNHLKLARNNILNTSLFNDVQISLQPSQIGDEYRDININVVEEWYIFVIPQIDLGDRNFNEWIERGAKLDRIIFGVDVEHENFSGNRDKLEVGLLGGFVKKVEVKYNRPFIDKKQSLGANFKVHYSTANQVAYRTFENKLDYWDPNRRVMQRFHLGGGLTKRKGLYFSYGLNLSYNDNFVDDSVAVLSEDYFLDGKTHQQFFEMGFNVGFNKFDRRPYPMRGFGINSTITKQGLGIFNDVNIFKIDISASKHFPISNKLNFATKAYYYISTPIKQPYNLYGALGYNSNFIRGNELYVVNGNQYMYNRNEIKFRILQFKVDISSVLKMSQFNKIPYGIYLKTFFDHGYASDRLFDPGNALLANEYQFGYGGGVDIVTFYDIVVRLEYAFNNLDESGFFFHMKKAI